MTFVEDFLTTQGITIKDKGENLIFQKGNRLSIIVNKPFVVEKLDLAKAIFNRKERDIKFLSYDDLRKWGWLVYQRRIRTPTYDHSQFFPPNQRIYYFPWEEEKNPPSYSLVEPNLPADVRIRYQIKTRLFRLEGPNTGPNWVGRWRPLDKNRQRLQVRIMNRNRERKRRMNLL